MELTKIKEMRQMFQKFFVWKAIFYMDDGEYIYRSISEEEFQLNKKSNTPIYYQENENGDIKSKV